MGELRDVCAAEEDYRIKYACMSANFVKTFAWGPETGMLDRFPKTVDFPLKIVRKRVTKKQRRIPSRHSAMLPPLQPRGNVPMPTSLGAAFP